MERTMSTKKTQSVTLTKSCLVQVGTQIEFTNDDDKLRFVEHVIKGIAVKKFNLKVGMKIIFTDPPKYIQAMK